MSNSTKSPTGASDDAKMSQQHVQEVEDVGRSPKDADIELNDNEVDPATKRLERRVKWKLDLFILPLISLVYFCATLGRTDLGSAKIAGMEDELNHSPAAYSLAANCFIIGYISFQLPGTLLLKKDGPSMAVRRFYDYSGLNAGWGVLTAVSVKVTDAASLQAMRFLIGAAEASIQGSVFYLSFWYAYRELATHGSIVHACNALAGAFNGLIAYWIAKNLEGHSNWHAWRWIFLVEGFIPIGASVLVMAFLPGTPWSVHFGFEKEEIELAVQRSMRAHNDPEGKLEMKKVYLPLMDVHFWFMAIMTSAGQFCTSSLSNFLPSIIRGLGYSRINSQLMTVIVYACAFVGILLFARLADKTNARGLTLAVLSSIAAVSYALLIGLTNNKARLAATCIVAFWGISTHHVDLVLDGNEGAAIAMMNMISTAFAIVGNTVYSDPPCCDLPLSAISLSTKIPLMEPLQDKKGNAAALGFEALCALTAIKRCEQFSEESNAMRLKTIYEVGDKHPDFFYVP